MLTSELQTFVLANERIRRLRVTRIAFFLSTDRIDVSKAIRLIRFLGGCALATKPALAYVLTARGIPAASPRWFAAAGGDIGVGVRLVSEWVDVGQFLD
jgi:hypothetical protein